MEPIVLTDPTITPDNKLIYTIIGDKSIYWQKILDYLYQNHKDISEVWRFYNDGKAWLFRTLKKKNTIFWVGVIQGAFRITFWFSDKAAPIIEQSDLPEKLKDEYRNAKKFNTIRAVSLVISSDEDLAAVFQLIELKLKIK